MNVNELTGAAWYLADILIREDDGIFRTTEDLDKIKVGSLFYGSNEQLRSDLYKDICSMKVQSFGVIDNTIVIIVPEGRGKA